MLHARQFITILICCLSTSLWANATTQFQGGSVGFSSPQVHCMDHERGRRDSILLTGYTGAPLRALQFRLVNTGPGRIRLTSAFAGASFEENPDWVTSITLRHGALLSDLGSNDTVVVVVLGQGSAQFAEDTMRCLLYYEYDPVDVGRGDTAVTTLEILDLIGSLQDGSDALLSADNVQTIVVTTGTEKGDCNGDDDVNINDLIAMIDVIAGKQTFSDLASQDADIAPWPTGDGMVNVRDLALTQWVILSGAYPDGTRLRFSNPPGDDSFLWKSSPAVKLTFYVSSTGVTLVMESSIRVRGIQAELANVPPIPDTAVLQSAFGSGYFVVNSSVLRMLLFSDSGLPLDAGARQVGSLAFPLGSPMAVNLKKVVIAAEDNTPVLNAEIGIIYGSPNSVRDPALPRTTALPSIWPNPSSGMVNLAWEGDQKRISEVRILDGLGRLVRSWEGREAGSEQGSLTWDGRSLSGARVPSGLYSFLFLSQGRVIGHQHVRILR